MHADPRKTVLSRDQVFIEGLVLVPKDNDSQSRHRWAES
jgi:hypothetical protein